MYTDRDFIEQNNSELQRMRSLQEDEYLEFALQNGVALKESPTYNPNGKVMSKSKILDIAYPDVPTMIQQKHEAFVRKINRNKDLLDSTFENIHYNQKERYDKLTKLGFKRDSRIVMKRVFEIDDNRKKEHARLKAMSEIQSYLDKYRLKFIPSESIDAVIKHDLRRFELARQITQTYHGMSPETTHIVADINNLSDTEQKTARGYKYREGTDIEPELVHNNTLVLVQLERFVGVIPDKNLDEMTNFPLIEQLYGTFVENAVVVTPAINVEVKAHGALPDKIIDPAVLIPLNAFKHSTEMGSLYLKHQNEVDGYIMVTAWGEEAKMPEFMNAHNN